MRHLFTLFICMVLSHGVYGQTLNKDSLERLLVNAKADTNRVILLFTLSEEYDNDEIGRARNYIMEAGRLSKKLDYDAGTLRFNKRMLYIHAILSQHDSAIWYGHRVLDIARAERDTFNIGVALFNIGERYNYKSDYETGIQYSLQGMKILEGGNHPPRIQAALTGGVAATYLMMKNYDKSIEYGKKAEAIERTLEDKSPLTGTLINLGNAYTELNQLKEAEQVYKEALALVRQYENISYEIMVCEGLVDLNSRQNNVDAIKKYSERGLALSIQLADSFNIMACSQGLSHYYLRTGDFSKAKELLLEALHIAEKNSYTEAQGMILQGLSNVSFAAQDYANGTRYQNESSKLFSDIFTGSLAQRHAEFREKYEAEKKDSQIKLQAASIRQKNTLNYILIGGTIALFIILLLAWLNYRHKQKLQESRIEELETEKQLAATEAVLKGEEKERTRIAKDLHDGLGGLLSGIKYSFQNMKENLILTPENAHAFERSMDMLDSSIKEMRRVAHNMMPEMLLRYGLDAALKEFCNEIDRSGVLCINYHSMGITNENVDQTTAVTVYRVVQELINNTIKHASASHALVQVHVSEQDKTLSLTVEDDGKGFEPAQLQQSTGLGWNNIRNRIDFLRGRIDVKAAPGKGTSVLIEVEIR